MKEKILQVNDLKKYFPIKKGLLGKTVNNVKAIDGISFFVEQGETLGLVGESGCGKSTTARVILRLLEPTAGQVMFRGQDITTFSTAQMRNLRKDIQIIFQDPYASLNPRMTVGQMLKEAFTIHGEKKGHEMEEVEKLLEIVGIRAEQMKKYPHEFSGGQRQRIGFARALALRPSLILCDEPVSALDVSIQAQILNLMRNLQKELNLTYLFISHDLSVVRHVSDRIAVMYLGKIVETADKHELYTNPKHPYTKALLSSVPIPRPGAKKERIILKGTIPSPLNPPQGCRFNTRCPMAKDICREKEPQYAEVGTRHYTACHFSQDM
jgi:oligopeptide transport system ATP-binding protein